MLASRGVTFSTKALTGAMLEARGWLQINAYMDGLAEAAKTARKKS